MASMGTSGTHLLRKPVYQRGDESLLHCQHVQQDLSALLKRQPACLAQSHRKSYIFGPCHNPRVISPVYV
jgi:hypothetical protein